MSVIIVIGECRNNSTTSEFQVNSAIITAATTNDATPCCGGFDYRRRYTVLPMRLWDDPQSARPALFFSR